MLAIEEGQKFNRDELSCEMVVRATRYSIVDFFYVKKCAIICWGRYAEACWAYIQ